MSKHQDALLRQWFMLRQVPRYPRKITVQELRRALAGEGYEITERSLQRDLNELSGAFAIVCDDREKPYFWMLQADRTKRVGAPCWQEDQARSEHQRRRRSISCANIVRVAATAAYSQMSTYKDPQCDSSRSLLLISAASPTHTKYQ